VKTHFPSLAILFIMGTLSVTAESLIVTNGESIEMDGTYNFENVLISNGTVYLTNNTTITSSGDISILSDGTITWHYTTTNWVTNIYLDSPGGSSGSGASVIARNGTNAWHLTLHSTSNLTINGTVDLRGGTGQSHVGSADQGTYGGTFYNPEERSAHKGGNGGTSYGGHGGAGAEFFLISECGYIELTSADIILSGGNGGASGNGGAAGGGGDYDGYPEEGQGADGGNGGDSIGGNGGNGGSLIIRTMVMNIAGWSLTNLPGHGGSAGSEGYPDEPGYGYKIIGEKTVSWNGNSGGFGSSQSGQIGMSGAMDVIKQAEARPSFENGQLRLSLDMSSTSATYIVECCTNLVTADWQTTGSFSGANGETSWSEAQSNRSNKAFYRIQTTY
jgi:hypothetical protein